MLGLFKRRRKKSAEDYSHIVDYIRMRHIGSLVKYLEEHREGLHVTDLIYGCSKYANWIANARSSGVYTRNIEENGLLKLAIGKLLHEIHVGEWSNIKIEFDGVYGEIDDIIFRDGTLIVIDKKTTHDKPPKEAHDHYVIQVKAYMLGLKRGNIISCERGDVEKLRRLVNMWLDNKISMLGAILYIDASRSTVTMISEVKIVEPPNSEFEKQFIALIEETLKRPKARPSWFCYKYCPIMNKCYVEEGWADEV